MQCIHSILVDDSQNEQLKNLFLLVTSKFLKQSCLLIFKVLPSNLFHTLHLGKDYDNFPLFKTVADHMTVHYPLCSQHFV